MKVIRNRLIPFKGFKCINLFGVLFVRSDSVMSDLDFNHEAIHTSQMKELLYFPFYLLYVSEWLYRLFKTRGNFKEAYRTITFECEAYSNQNNFEYIKIRKPYSQYKNK
jgi:hypothetical protein|nr:MAG TPA: hypothetical protein [Bacteriophage sp.]